MATITTEALRPADMYQISREREIAEAAKAIRITSRPTNTNSSKAIGHCVWCGNLATVDLLFHYEVNQMRWVIVEKHCDSCTKNRHPDLATLLEAAPNG